MFKKLQVKFVALVMGVVALILCAVFASIGVMTYQQAVEQLASDMHLAIAISAGDQRDMREVPGGGREPWALDAEAAIKADDRSSPPQLGKHPEERLDTPVAVYLLEEGAVSLAPRSGAALDEDALADLTAAALEAPFDEVTPCGQGIVLLKQDVMGSVCVAFANDSARASVQGLLPICAVVGSGALLAFFVISIVFSRWALRPVRQAWDQQRAFVSNASHELKTPLSIIKANTEILLEEPAADAEARGKWLVSTQEAAEGMDALVGDMLALASLDEIAERGGVVADSQAAEPFDASRLLEGLTLQFESRAFEGGFTLEPAIAEGVLVRADAEAVERLTRILLDNACKYVDAGGSVFVQLARAGAVARVSVANTGPQIPPEQLERIFQRFYRADEAHAGEGHGLGLSIAKALSDQLDAGLAVTSTEEATCFTFHLPLS